MNKDEYEYEFERLIVYQKAILFINDVYAATTKFPVTEQYKITAQFIRAAHSIALNIAEGTGGTKPEFKNFLRFSKRSTRECVVCITIAANQNYLNEVEIKLLRSKCSEISKMLTGLMNSIT